MKATIIAALCLGLGVLSSCGGKTALGVGGPPSNPNSPTKAWQWQDAPTNPSLCGKLISGNTATALGNWSLHQTLGQNSLDWALTINSSYTMLTVSCNVGGQNAASQAKVASTVDDKQIHVLSNQQGFQPQQTTKMTGFPCVSSISYPQAINYSLYGTGSCLGVNINGVNHFYTR